MLFSILPRIASSIPSHCSRAKTAQVGSRVHHTRRNMAARCSPGDRSHRGHSHSLHPSCLPFRPDPGSLHALSLRLVSTLRHISICPGFGNCTAHRNRSKVNIQDELYNVSAALAPGLASVLWELSSLTPQPHDQRPSHPYFVRNFPPHPTITHAHSPVRRHIRSHPSRPSQHRGRSRRYALARHQSSSPRPASSRSSPVGPRPPSPTASP